MGKIRPWAPKPWKRKDICSRGHDRRITATLKHSRNCRLCVVGTARERRTGCTEEMFTKLVLAQAGVCAICNKKPLSKHGLQADHCHKTGKIRGLLCGPCNLGIGNAYESLEILDAMADYLVRTKS